MTPTPRARRRDLLATVFVDRFESGGTGAWDSTVSAP